MLQRTNERCNATTIRGRSSADGRSATGGGHSVTKDDEVRSELATADRRPCFTTSPFFPPFSKYTYSHL